MRKSVVGVGALALGIALTGCTSVKMVQREECWVRRTEKWYGAVTEELGPCARAEPAWVQDRHTRLVQECVAQADHRWQTKALEAFSKGQPYPEQESQEKLLSLCMSEAARAYIVENDELKARLSEAKSEREELKGALARNEEHLRNNNDRLSQYLGEAAQKPPGTATATATSTSDTKASTENSSKREETATAPQPVAPAITWVSTGGQQPVMCAQQPQVDEADAARTVAAPETISAPTRKAPPQRVSRKKPANNAETVSGPRCEPAATPAETAKPPAGAEVAKVVPADSAKPNAEQPAFEGPELPPANP